MSLAEQVAIVTGASSGIGAAIALALAKEGATVVVAARRSDQIERIADAASVLGGRAIPLRCDVADEESVSALFAAVDARLGRVDLLVNNAGTLSLSPLHEMSVSEWDRVLAVNLRGAFLCSKQALLRMRTQSRGRIINIGSLSALRVRSNNAAYNASKFALEGLTHSLALEGRPFGISCGVLHPGNTRSEITDRPDFPEAMMDAEDVARAAVLMATAPSHVNVYQIVMHPVEQQFIGRG